MFRVEMIAEEAVGDALRARLDALLAAEFEIMREPPRGRGWTQKRPAERVVAFEGGGEPVGQVAVVDAGRRMRVAGIADVVVAPAHRGRGLGSRLLDAALETATARAAAIVFAASDRPPVIEHLCGRRGFRAARPFELYWVAEDRCLRNPDWLVRRGAPQGSVEIVSDV